MPYLTIHTIQCAKEAFNRGKKFLRFSRMQIGGMWDGTVVGAKVCRAQERKS